MQQRRLTIPSLLVLLVGLQLTLAGPAQAVGGRATRTSPLPVTKVLIQPEVDAIIKEQSTLPRFAQVAPLADDGSVATAAKPAAARLQLDTGLCVAFFGAADEPEPAPDRDSVHGNPTTPDATNLCQLTAGVSYNLAPGAQLNLGYQLPNRMLGDVGRNLGLEDPSGDDSLQKFSVGVQVTF